MFLSQVCWMGWRMFRRLSSSTGTPSHNKTYIISTKPSNSSSRSAVSLPLCSEICRRYFWACRENWLFQFCNSNFWWRCLTKTTRRAQLAKMVPPPETVVPVPMGPCGSPWESWERKRVTAWGPLRGPSHIWCLISIWCNLD